MGFNILIDFTENNKLYTSTVSSGGIGKSKDLSN